jgi:hypothetical protein
LRRPFRCNTPEEVVQFLADNSQVPSRFIEGKRGDLKPADQQFPTVPAVTPVRYRPGDSEPIATDTAQTLDDTFDAFTAARAWFAYAQDPLPDPEPPSEILDRKDRVKTLKGRRLPRQPAEVIFRQSPCRAQSYVGERLHKEGWFDNTGWAVDGGRAGLGRWFPARDVVIGAGRDYAIEAWERAFLMWRDFGQQNGMLLSATEELTQEKKAEKFRQRYLNKPNETSFPFRPETFDAEMKESLEAHKRLSMRGTNLNMTNFMHHYVKAEAERDRETA